MECATGLIGTFQNSDAQDCTWRRYKPHLPLWETTFIDRGDFVSDYVPWTCTDSSELETYDTNGNRIEEHPHGWEPDNNDEGDEWDGDDDFIDWEVDGTTIITE